MITREVATKQCSLALLKLAYWISEIFPHHGKALKDEIESREITSDRWNDLASILISLKSVPGIPLSKKEHNIRNVALGAIAIPQMMSRGTFGNGNDSYIQYAYNWSLELEKELENV